MPPKSGASGPTARRARCWSTAWTCPPVSLETYTELLRPECDAHDTSQRLSLAFDTLEGEFVGWINVHAMDERHGSAGVSVFREHQRKGYAEDALRLVLRCMFRERRYHKCDSQCLDLNEGSLRLHRKLGFVEEGRRRQSVYIHGEYHDRVPLGLLEDEFEDNDRQG